MLGQTEGSYTVAPLVG